MFTFFTQRKLIINKNEQETKVDLKHNNNNSNTPVDICKTLVL